jgi:trimeric autotransporter adhesin
MLRMTSAIALLVAACSDDPLLGDPDAGPNLADGDVNPDGGPRDGGSPDAATPDGGVPDAGGPACDEIPAELPGDPLSAEWEARFGSPGVSGTSPAVTEIDFMTDGDVIIAGDFDIAGYEAARNVARFDQATGWSALGDGLDGRVLAMAISPDDDIVIAYQAPGDDFDSARLVRFDDTSWVELATASGGMVQSIEYTPDGALLAGGYFTRIGGVEAAKLARYDETGWHAFPGLAIDNGVSAIDVVSATDFCIGGDFTTLGTVEARQVACSIAGTWQARGLPLPFYQVNALGRDRDGNLIAAGNFVLDDTSETDGGGVARWVTDHWEVVGGGVTEFPSAGHSGLVRGVASATHGLYAGGSFNFAGGSRFVPTESVARYAEGAWTDIGGLWRDMGGFIDENVWAVATGPDDSVYFGGLFTHAGTVRAAHVVRYDGTYWRALRGTGQSYDGIAGNVMALESYASCGVFVGGAFTYAGEIRADNIAFYSRTEGYSALGPGVDGPVTSLALTPDGRLYAGGGFVNRESSEAFSRLAVWDGAAWHAVGAPPDDFVWTLAVDPSTGIEDPEKLYVGGSFANVGASAAHAIAVWDGTTLTELGGGMTGHVPVGGDEPSPATVYALLIDPTTGDLLVGGNFSRAGSAVATNVARWDGEEWHPFGDGLGDGVSSVLALEIHEGRLYAGGTFEASGAATLESIAVWTGTAWENVGPGLSSSTPPNHYGRTVSTLLSVGSALYVGGIFSVTPGEPERMIAVYDGTSFRDLEEGMSDLVNALAWQNEGVYAGGAFGRAGTTPSSGLSLWRFTE